MRVCAALLLLMLCASPARPDASVREPPPRCGDHRWHALEQAAARWCETASPRDFGMIDESDRDGKLALARACRLVRRALSQCTTELEWDDEHAAWLVRTPDDRWDGDWSWRLSATARRYEVVDVSFIYLGCH